MGGSKDLEAGSGNPHNCPMSSSTHNSPFVTRRPRTGTQKRLWLLDRRGKRTGSYLRWEGHAMYRLLIYLFLLLLQGMVEGVLLKSAAADGPPPVRFGVSFPVSLQGSGSAQGKPVIASDGTNFFVVWLDKRNFCTNGYDIYGARVTPDGVVLDPTGIPISTFPNMDPDPGSQYIPSVEFDGTNYLVVWTETRNPEGTHYEIYAARVTPGGTVLDPNGVQITSSDASPLRMPSIAFDGTNFLITWRNANSQIRGTRVSPSLEVLDGANGFLIGDGFYPCVAFDGTNYLVVWHGWSNGVLTIFGARVTPAASVLDSFTISSATENQDHASVACSGGNCLAVWHRYIPGLDGNTGRTYGARISTAGVVLDNPAIKIANYTRGSPRVVFDGTDYLVVWQDDFGLTKFRDTDAFGCRVSTEGLVLDERAIPIATSYRNQWSPVIGVHADRYLVVWSDHRWTRCSECLYGQLLQRPTEGQAGPPSQQNNNKDAPLPTGGSDWIAEQSPAGAMLNAIRGFDGTHVYATGEDAKLFQYNGSEWATVAEWPTGRQYTLWPLEPNDVWSVGNCWDVGNFDGQNVNTSGCLSPAPGGEAGYTSMGIWGTSNRNLFTVGIDGGILHYDGGPGNKREGWKRQPVDVMGELWDVWGTSSTNVYAVGEYGTVLKYDGLQWSKIPGIPTFQSLNGIWGSSANDIFVVGDYGTILHYDGTSWRAQDSGTMAHLIGVWGCSSSEVYAVGMYGTILHYDGNAWLPEASGTSASLSAIWGEGNSMLAVGGEGTILRKTVGCPVCPVPVITSQPQSQTIANGQTAILSVTATETDLSYQWYQGLTEDTSSPVGTNTSNFTTPALTQTISYWVKVWNRCGFMHSEPATVTVTQMLTVASSNPNSGVSITVTPNDNNGQSYGMTPLTRIYNHNTLVMLAAPLTGPGLNSFQKWQYGGIDYSFNVSTTVTMNASYTMTAVYAPCASLAITSQPQSQTIASGQTATLSVTATGPGLGYQWYQGLTGDTSSPVGTNSSSFTTPALTETISYWVMVWSTCGFIYSNTATISVTYTVTASVGGDPLGGSITPSSRVVNHGSSAIFTVTTNVGYTASVSEGTLVGSTWTIPNVTSTHTATVTFTTVCPTPGTPSSPSPSNGATGQPTSLTLSWSSTSNTDSYDVYFGTPSNLPLVGNVTSASYPLSGLSTNTTYYWKIVAKNSCGQSTTGPLWGFTTLPSAPTLSSPSNGATGVPTNPALNWNASSGATSYRLQVSTSNAFSTTVFDQSGIVSTSQVVSGLLNNTTYYWRVNASNAGGTSGWSSIWSFTTVVSALTPINDTTEFVKQQYLDFLNREAETAGLQYWVGLIDSGAMTRAQVIESFFWSEEFRARIAPIVRLYFAYFLRIPDYEGLMFWINAYNSGGSLEAISDFFAGSEEFQQHYGALSNEGFVNLIYQNILGRAPDPGGYAFWVGELNSGRWTRGQVMIGFSESAEYKGLTSHEVYVTMMYVGMLRRSPEEAGFNFWVNYLDSGNSGLALIDGFLNSQEYADRFQ